MRVLSTGQWTGTGLDQLLVEGTETGAGVTVILQHMPQGSGPRLHWHPYGETWIVVEGRIGFSDGETLREGGPGDVVHVAARQPHGFTVLSEGRVRMICIHESPRNETNWLE